MAETISISQQERKPIRISVEPDSTGVQALRQQILARYPMASITVSTEDENALIVTLATTIYTQADEQFFQEMEVDACLIGLKCAKLSPGAK